jgi:predicted nucleic acid-binding Zn ribbon protein
MARSNEQTLGEVIKELLKVYRLERGVNSARIINSWERVVGSMIANHTTSIALRGKTLYVKLDSAALKNELSYAKDKLIRNINEEIESNAVDTIVFQ